MPRVKGETMAAIAKGGSLGFFRASAAGKVAVHQDPGEECDSQIEGTSQGGATSEDQESDDQHCDASDESTSDQSSDPSDRQKACREAAGITDGTEG